MFGFRKDLRNGWRLVAGEPAEAGPSDRGAAISAASVFVGEFMYGELAVGKRLASVVRHPLRAVNCAEGEVIELRVFAFRQFFQLVALQRRKERSVEIHLRQFGLNFRNIDIPVLVQGVPNGAMDMGRGVLTT